MNRGPSSATRAPWALVVDPDEDSRALMRLVLEIGGLAVAEYASGDGLVAEIARVRPDLIVIEERLPRIDGRMACRQLRRAGETIRHTPVIFVSSSSSASSARLAFEAGCTFYFVKPFDIEELVDAATELTRAKTRAGQ